MNKNKMVLIDAGIFCVGMIIKSSVYYLYGDSYILLCRNVLVDEEIMRRLRNAERTYGGVFIEEDKYEEFWKESLARYSYDLSEYEATFKKVKQDYANVLAKTESYIDSVATDGKVSQAQTQTLAQSISDELCTLDQSLVLQCINQIGEVDNYLYTHCVNVGALNGLLGK